MRILAGNIRNLTDARYFAAWHVEALIYALDDLTLVNTQRIKEISDWVEGPQVMLNVDNLLYDLTPDFMEEISVSEGVISLDAMSKNADYAWISSNDQNMDTDQSLIINFRLSDEALSQITSSPQKVYISYLHNDAETILRLYHDYSHIGIYVEGGSEEKVGLKAFDDLDQLLEKIAKKEEV